MSVPEFEYIIVGTGSGGGHAAARLVLAGKKTLALEAGGDFWDYATNSSKVRNYNLQMGANDETLWDWDYRVDPKVTGYEGTYGGAIRVVGVGAGTGANITITGIPAMGPLVLTAFNGAPGLNQYDDSGTIAQIAVSMWTAINNPANGFAARGIKARVNPNSGQVIIDRILPVVGVTVLATSNPLKSVVAVNTTPVTQIQATITERDQSMGRMVGGSGNHFGYICYRASLEDYDEWDYAIVKNSTAALNDQGVLTGTVTWGGAAAIVGVGTKFTTELKVGDYIQDMTGGAPYATVPMRVSAITDDLNLTLDPDPTGKPFSATGAGASALKNTIWNRSRTLAIYKAIEKDLQYGPAGTNPNPVLHASNAWPATELGYVGKDGLGDTTPAALASGGVPPSGPVVTRVPTALNAMIQSLRFSVQPTAAPTNVAFPLVPIVNGATYAPPFWLTIDRNGENNWGNPVSNVPGTPPANLTGVDPYSVHKIPMNEIGFDTAGNGVAGGMQSGGFTHLNKYSNRRSQLIVAIDPIRSNANFTLRSDCVVNKVLFEGYKAVGVEYYQRDEEGGEWTRKQVFGTNIVLSAGPFGSPAILLRSGIGAIDRLAPHGIVQLLDLPGVGADVINHQSLSSIGYTLPTSQPENNILLSGVYYAGLYKSTYTMSPSRAIASAVGNPPVLFDQGPECRFNLGQGVGNEAAPITNTAVGLLQKQAQRIYSRVVSVGVNMFKNRSRGDGVRLRSPWPFDTPILQDGRVNDPNALEAEAFIELATVLSSKVNDAAVVDGLRAVFGVSPVTPNVALPVTPTKIGIVHATVTTSLHAVSTVKMGPPGELLSGFRTCLDQYGRLYGISNLAVCDNSIYPTHTRANPHLPTVAAAENLTAEWIAHGGLVF